MMDKSGFLAYIFRLRYINRWGLMKNTENENVAQHSFDTAVIAHALALIARDICSKDIDPEKIACAALYHDVSEVITGDMPSPIKYVSPEIVNMYKELENNAKETLLSDIPSALEKSYRKFLFLTDEEERYVKAADKLSAYFKCVSELKGSNSEFKNAKENILASVKSMGMDEVDIFLSMFEEAVNFDLDALASGNVK